MVNMLESWQNAEPLDELKLVRMQYKFINNMGRIHSGDNTGTFFPKFKGLGLKLFSTRK